MSLSNHAEDLLLNFLLNTETATRPTAWHAALHTADPGETGASEVLVASDADYVRKAVTFAASSGGSTSNTGAVTWTPAVAAGTYTITHVSIWDAATVGNCLFIGELVSSRSVSNANPFTLAIGAIVAALD